MLEVFASNAGRVRANAVSRLASSRVLVGLDPLVGEEEPSFVVINVEGSIFPMKVHLFLLGVVGSAVSFGSELSVVSSFVSAAREWRLDWGVAAVPDKDGARIPSNPTNIFEAGD